MLFLIAIYFSKNDNKPASEMKHYYHGSYFVLGPILTTGLKCQPQNFSKITFCWQTALQKNPSQSSTE